MNKKYTIELNDHEVFLLQMAFSDVVGQWYTKRAERSEGDALYEYCNDMVKEYNDLNRKVAEAKEQGRKSLTDKYFEAAARFKDLSHITMLVEHVNCHVRYLKDRLAANQIRFAEYEADDVAKCVDALVQAVEKEVR